MSSDNSTMLGKITPMLHKMLIFSIIECILITSRKDPKDRFCHLMVRRGGNLLYVAILLTPMIAGSHLMELNG